MKHWKNPVGSAGATKAQRILINRISVLRGSFIPELFWMSSVYKSTTVGFKQRLIGHISCVYLREKKCLFVERSKRWRITKGSSLVDFFFRWRILVEDPFHVISFAVRILSLMIVTSVNLLLKSHCLSLQSRDFLLSLALILIPRTSSYSTVVSARTQSSSGSRAQNISCRKSPTSCATSRTPHSASRWLPWRPLRRMSLVTRPGRSTSTRASTRMASFKVRLVEP